MNVLCIIKPLYSNNECIMSNAPLYYNPGRPASRPVCWPEPAGLYAGVGRSLCQSRPVSMPEPAGLYARAGRSLCQRRPVSMPANPFSTVSPCPPGVFFSAKKASKNQIMRIYYKLCVFVCFCKKNFVVYHDQGHDKQQSSSYKKHTNTQFLINTLFFFRRLFCRK